MARQFARVLFLIGLLAIVFSYASLPLIPAGEASGVTIVLSEAGFDPPVLVVTTGTEVTWVNQTATDHFLQSGQVNRLYLPLMQKNGTGGGALTLPGGHRGKTFGGALPAGGFLTHTFTIPGEYPYYLTTAPHLTGRVIVEEQAPTPTPSSSATASPTGTTPLPTSTSVATATGIASPSGTPTATSTSTATATASGKSNLPPVLNVLDDVSVPLGRTLEMALSASDPDGDPVTFSATPLPLPANMTLDTRSGELRFRPDGLQVGSLTLTFVASDGRGGTDSQAIRINVEGGQPGAPTSFTARLLDADALAGGDVRGVEGATISIAGSAALTTSDADGYFTLDDLPYGEQQLFIQGGTATPAPGGAPYIGYAVPVTLIEGVVNHADLPYLLPRMDLTSATEVDPEQSTIVTHPTLGITITILPHSARNPDGSEFTGSLAITAMGALAPASRAAESRGGGLLEGILPAPPNGDGPGFFLGALPEGGAAPPDIFFDQPVSVTAPNPDNHPLLARLDLWTLVRDLVDWLQLPVLPQVQPDGKIAFALERTGLFFYLPVAPTVVGSGAPDYRDAKTCCNQPTGSLTDMGSGTLRVSHSLAPYLSVGMARSLRLAYTSTSADPRPVVSVDVSLAAGDARGERLSARLEVAGIEQGVEIHTGSGQLLPGVEEILRQAMHFDASTFATGRYPYRLTITHHFAASRVGAVHEGHVLVNNEQGSPYGAGWTIAGVQRLYEQVDGSVVVTEGDGSIKAFTPAPEAIFTPDEHVLALFEFEGNVSDTSGNGRDAVLLGGEFIETSLGQGLRVGPTRPAGIDWSAHAGLLSHPYTVEMVFIPDEVDGFRKLFGFDDTNDWGWYLRAGAFDPFPGDEVGTGIMLPGERQYIAVVSTAADRIDIYINGVYAGNTVATFNAPPAGAIFFQDDSVSGNEQLSGVVELLRLSSTSRSDEEIAQAYQRLRVLGRPGVEAGDLVVDGDYSRLEAQPGGGYQRVYRDGSRLIFNAAGLLEQITDRNGNSTLLAYDAQQRLTTVTDPVGKQTTLAYVPFLASMTDPAGRTTTFGHDDSGNLLHVTDPDGSSRAFTYDEQHRMSTQSSKRGFVTHYEYNFAGRHVRAIRPDGSTREVTPGETLALVDPASGSGTENMPAPPLRAGEARATWRDGFGQATTFRIGAFGASDETTDPLGRQTTAERDEHGNPSRVVSANGAITRLAYDENGNLLHLTEVANQAATQRTSHFRYEPRFSQLVSYTDPAGYLTQIEHDEYGNPILITDALGGETTLAYNTSPQRGTSAPGLGQLLAATDPNGNTTHFEYDGAGNLIEISDALGNVTRMTRDAAGNVLAITQGVGTPEERTSTFVYDTLNRPIATTDGTGATTLYRYDAAGNLLEIESPTGEVTRYEYDELNRITAVEEPIRGRTENSYDANGNLVTTTDALGAVSLMEYDAANQLTRTVDALGGEQLFEYDEMGNLLSFTDTRGQTTRYIYDLLTRLTRETNPLNHYTDYFYDERDNLVRQYVNGQSNDDIEYRYDELSRLVEVETPDNLLNYSYDAAGNLLAATDDDSALAFSYDALNRVAQVETQLPGGLAVTLAYDYDAVGDRRRMSDSLGGTTTYEYDDTGRLTGLLTPAGDAIAQVYDPAGRLLETLFPNSITAGYEYDAAGRLLSLTHEDAAGDALLDLGYSYNALGNITSISEELTARAGVVPGQIETRTFSYDLLERLTGAGTASEPESYAYDAAGNRIVSHLSASHTHNAANRLLSDDNYSYEYDVRGNLIRRSAQVGGAVTDYAFDRQNQMVGIDLPGGGAVSYRYDALGRRIEKNVDGEITRYLYDGMDIVLEFDGANAPQARYSHGATMDRPLSMERGGERYYYHADHLGSIRLVTDASGNVVNRYEYDSYGRVSEQVEGVANPYTYSGREYDAESGLYYYRARYYDPGTGRFLSEDPLGFMAGDANLYRYVGGNPVNYRDPLGLDRTDKIMEQVYEENWERWYKLAEQYRLMGHGPSGLSEEGVKSRMAQEALAYMILGISKRAYDDLEDSMDNLEDHADFLMALYGDLRNGHVTIHTRVSELRQVIDGRYHSPLARRLRRSVGDNLDPNSTLGDYVPSQFREVLRDINLQIQLRRGANDALRMFSAETAPNFPERTPVELGDGDCIL